MDLKKILDGHSKWLRGESGGVRANLADAYLTDAYLTDAYLTGADLARANLVDANLAGANLVDANLAGANLIGANLTGANLADANLAGAYLAGAYLSGANLARANLARANLDGAKNIPQYVLDVTMVPPESGAFVAWKQCRSGILVKLQIPASAKRSSSTGRKCRASAAKVLEIIGADKAESTYQTGFFYTKGKTLRVQDFDENRWNECSSGIHFFMTRGEAERYQP